MEQFAQGIHALQDAYAHQGSSLAFVIDEGEEKADPIPEAVHGYNDLTAKRKKAIEISKTVILVMVFLTEDYAALEGEDIVLDKFLENIEAMSDAQLNQLNASNLKYLKRKK